jgi:uncharacterized membrane protein YdjX (TVP38/TMEM64 family)
LVLGLFVVAMIAAYWLTPLRDWLSIEQLKQSRQSLEQVVAERPYQSAAAFFLFCAIATAVSFPVAPLIGLAAGVLFGFWAGLALALTAQSIGSTIAFLAARYLARDWVERTLGARLEPIDRGMERHGALYLLTLRFNPVIPYWLVNLATGLTRMRLAPYAALTPIGLLPAMSIYVNAGTQLSTIESAGDILSPGLIVALLLLSLFPLIIRAALPLTRRIRT